MTGWWLEFKYDAQVWQNVNNPKNKSFLMFLLFYADSNSFISDILMPDER